MTREEAIKKIKKVIEESVIFEDELEAFDIAIKALEHPEKNVVAVVPCGDAISRQAVLDAFWKLNVELSPTAIWTIQNMVKDVPSVTPQQRTGRWEWVQYDYNPKLGNWHCSECRSVVMECVDKNEKSYIPLYKYCPQCGCKMEVGE